MTLQLPDRADRPIGLRGWLLDGPPDCPSDTMTLSFQTYDENGPIDELGTIRVPVRTLYRLLLSVREAP